MVKYRNNSGFTLIELSIVLVIIGLIVGGVLVGQDLIRAARIRAAISQIEKYNTAVHTFQVKYGGLPGDLEVSKATAFGFVTTNCSGSAGQRDGNGLIDSDGSSTPWLQTGNETALFWKDLSDAGLIDFNISPVSCVTGSNYISIGYNNSDPPVDNYFPKSKLDRSSYLFVYETNGYNWFELSGIVSVNIAGNMLTSYNLSVAEAYNIDKKYDDGNPATGSITTNIVQNGTHQYLNGLAVDSPTTCAHWYVNGIYNPGYSISVNDGNGLNCTLSFKMQ